MRCIAVKDARMCSSIDSREVQFSSATSVEKSPRLAANEAFDLAAAALTKAPNLCWFFISMENSRMHDAPEVLWRALRKANGVPAGARPTNVALLGSAVTQQKFNDGYIQVLLAAIPDLEVQPFTFDELPTATPQDTKRAFVCSAMLDGKLTVSHLPLVTQSVRQLSATFSPMGVPVVGGVLSQAARFDTGLADAIARKRMQVSELSESLSFINDNVYRGSAAGVVLRSNLVASKCLSHQPSINLLSTTIHSSRLDTEVVIISAVAAGRPTDIVRRLYETDLQGKLDSKIFVGVKHRETGAVVPLGFRGDPETGALTVYLPCDSLCLSPGDELHFVCDDVELDIEAIASRLLHFEKEVKDFTKELKPLTIEREGKRDVLVSSQACVHFSQFNYNQVARPNESTLDLSGTPMKFAPPIATRCLGQNVVTAGMFCPGQVCPFTETVEGQSYAGSHITSRSSAHLMLRGLK